MPANQVADLLEGARRRAVQQDTLQQPQPTTTPSFIGATGRLADRSAARRTPARASMVGVIDTGIWPEHPIVRRPGPPPAPAAAACGCEFGDGTDPRTSAPPFACNNKLIGAYAFTTPTWP